MVISIDEQTLLYSFDLLGTAVFAISGALMAAEKRMDLFGGVVLAMFTAVGGGTFRDMMLGRTPVFWMNDLSYCLVATCATLITYAVIDIHNKHHIILKLFDAVGLATFTVIGTQVALEAQVPALICIILAAVTACFGGVVRDICCQERPLVFQQDIYASAAMLGSCAILLSQDFGLSKPYTLALGFVFTLVTRLVAIRFSLQLPKHFSKHRR